MGHAYSRILFSDKMAKLAVQAKTQMNHKGMLLSRKRKLEKAAYFMTLFIFYSGKCKCEARGNPEKAMHAMDKESVSLINETIPLTKNRSIMC